MMPTDTASTDAPAMFNFIVDGKYVFSHWCL